MRALTSPMPAVEVMESKLLPPQERDGSVSRRTLIDAMEDQSGAVPVIFLSAGPGWGKTTLLAQWASHSQRPFAWMHVDENDNDPIVLLTYIAFALDRVSPLDPGVFEGLASPGVSIEGTIVPRLGAALATIDEPLVLVLDDLHLLDNQASLDAVATLARHVSAGSQLALSARGRPALPLAALRARGLQLEVGPVDLGMDAAQAAELLSAAGVDLSEADVKELAEHTEGWPAGLYLAALSIRARGAKAKGSATFSGSDRLVSDYLQSELLAFLSADELRFLTRTAVLDRLSGPLCDAVLGESGSATTLESLARSNLFLVPLDRSGEWYRYHHLFGELLRSDLERTEPRTLQALLVRAAEWYEAAGDPETAIGYAQQAGDVDRAARLIEHRMLPAYESGRVATVERWLVWAEAHSALEHNAAVATLGALLATAWGRASQADRWADAAERATYEGSLPDGSASIDSWLALLRTLQCRRGADVMRADAEHAVATIARGSPFWANTKTMHAVSLWLAGQVDQADDLLVDVADEGLELAGIDGVTVALGERAAIALGRGAWVQAEEFSERGLRVIRQFGMEAYPTSALVYAPAARVALHLGDVAGAQELIAKAQRVRPLLTYAMPHFSVQVRLELARAYLTLADAGGAATMLREIDMVLRRRPDLGELPAQVEELRATLATMRAHAPGASTLTEAELRVLPYLATHLTFRETGERLFLSRHTVKSHAMAIYRKLSASSRTAAVERAHELGLL
jgi:LuxR family transcriptional regulator, maltose regulon positive regulatory protein